MPYRADFRRGPRGNGKWARNSLDRVRCEARYLYDQVDRDVQWEWSEGGLAASDAELYRLGILYDQEVEEVEVASCVGEEVGAGSEAGDDWSVVDDGESVVGDWDLISELG